ncbi:hypothetical protein [Piscirickettsia litoralis]|nr:hypothetical protein [Piscirickettsia litoralis]
MSKQDFEMLGPIIWKAHGKAVKDLQNISESMYEELQSDNDKLTCMLTLVQELVRSVVSAGFKTCDNIDDESEGERSKHILFSAISQVLAQSGHEYNLRLSTQIDTTCLAWPIN